MNIDEKYAALRARISGYDQLLVAYSGGIDSTLVLKVAHDELGQRAKGVTADSPSVPRREIYEAKRIATAIGAQHSVMRTEEIDDPSYARNPINRCYYCKHELYTRLIDIARIESFKHIANGTNIDDLGDYRPGLQAADEFKVVSPLKDAGLSKADVREIAQMLRLETWDKPASPCLSSRIPYGQAVTRGKLAMVEAAEEFLRGLDIRELRVRHLGSNARIETRPDDFVVLQQYDESIRKRFREIGFSQFEVAEFKSGALNVAIKR